MFRFPFIILLLFLTGCNSGQKKQTFGKKQTSSAKTIYLHPLEPVKPELLLFIQDAIKNYFKVPVIITPVIKMNPRFLNMEKGKRYCADSIIKNLDAEERNNNNFHVGITHEDIFTTIEDENGKIKEPVAKYKVWGVFGLGYLPGNVCIVSDKRLFTPDPVKYLHRIRTVVLHEIGHNAGLSHCTTFQCIMSDANEKISTVDQSSNFMCTRCEKWLGLQD